MPLTSVSDQIYYCTVFLSGSSPDGRSWTGTGFVLDYGSEGNHMPILITNKHVLEGASTLTVRMVASDGLEPSRRATQIAITAFSDTAWTGHPDPNIDVAAMPLAVVVDAMVAGGGTPFYKTLAPEMMLTESEAEELEGIEQITFVGYPNGLFDTATYLPIARRGYTATQIYNNYRGEPAFLIDAAVFPGSSGSPVLLFDQGAYATRSGIVMGLRFKLLGILAAGHTRAVEGVVRVLPARTVAVHDEILGLGIVYKSSVIQECVNELFHRRGLTPSGQVPEVEELA